MGSLSFVTCFALLAIAAVGNGYDFSDSFYNRHLAHELEELYSAPQTQHSRFRRDEEAVNKEKCRMHHPRLCCAEDAIEIFAGSDAKRECFVQIMGERKKQGPGPDPFKCHNMEQHKKDLVCVMDCAAQKKNMIDSNGDMKEPEVNAVFKQVFEKIPWFAPLSDEATAKCWALTKNATSESEGCNPKPLTLSHCIFREIQMNCPENEIKDKESCARLRERMDDDGMMMPPPPPPGNP